MKIGRGIIVVTRIVRLKHALNSELRVFHLDSDCSKWSFCDGMETPWQHLVFQRPGYTKIFLIVLSNNKRLHLLFLTWEFKISSMKVSWYFISLFPAVNWAPYYAEEPESKGSCEKSGLSSPVDCRMVSKRFYFNWYDRTDLRPRIVYLHVRPSWMAPFASLPWQ